MPNPDTQITLELVGTPQEGGHLRLNDFLGQLHALRESLVNVNRILIHLSEARIYYRLVDLSHANGARVVIEPVTQEEEPESLQDIQALHDRFFQELTAIQENRPLSEEVDTRALESFQRLAVRAEQAGSAVIHNVTAKVVLDREFTSRVTTLIAREYFSVGSLTGELGTINLHGRARNFWIYPEIGPTKVLCKFDPSLKEKAKQSIEKVVTVRGRKWYRPNANFPYRIDALELEEVQEVPGAKHLLELRGTVPDATAGKDSEEFVRGIRDEWE